MKVRDAIRILEEHGFRLKRTRGSHRQFEGVVSGQRRLVTVAGKEGDELARPTLASIARQSALPGRVFGRR
ncbi:MAG: type II toxin-antitoxin system HicA family toxin [Bryobacterales bacterium]|nr:type II toxin-antitoxin system HicA family toxin [Bryobacterales bacterium]